MGECPRLWHDGSTYGGGGSTWGNALGYGTMAVHTFVWGWWQYMGEYPRLDGNKCTGGIP